MWHYSAFALSFAVSMTFLPACAASQGPCSMMTPGVATMLLGESVKPGREAGTTCVFSHSDKDDVMVSIQVVGDMGARLFDSIISDGGGTTNEPVPGLGEKASFQKSQTESDLYVLVHGNILTVGVRNSKSPNLPRAMVQAARAIIARL